MSGTKILIVDSSPVYRKMFVGAASEAVNHVLVSSASNEEEARRQILRHDFALIVIDTEISKGGLIPFLSEIYREIPDVFLLIAASPSPANEAVFAQVMTKAMEKGKRKVHCMIKPIYDSYKENYSAIKSTVMDILNSIFEEHQEDEHMLEQQFYPEIVFIASSTGGPLALRTILKSLSESFPAPILVVQHIQSHFMDGFVADLNKMSKLDVKLAKNKETIQAGIVYIAPGGHQMKLDAKKRIFIEKAPPVNGVSPSADVLFQSVSELTSFNRILAVILTGMGNDGEQGISCMKEKQNCFCIAQSERTCVIYGMPRAVIENGLADMVLDLNDIASAIEKFRFPATSDGES